MREHERKDELHVGAGEEESPKQPLLTEAPVIKRRRRVKRRVKAQRKPAHVRRTGKVAPPVKAPAPTIKVSRGRDIFGNTQNPYTYSCAASSFCWEKGKLYALGDLNFKKKKGGVVELKGKTLKSILNNLKKHFEKVRYKNGNIKEGLEADLWIERTRNMIKEFKENGEWAYKRIEQGYLQTLTDEEWKDKHKKQIGTASKRLQRKVTVAGSLTGRAYNKLVHSQAFKAWFGDWEAEGRNTSRVVDDQRKPKEQREIVVPAVVYHGTPQKMSFTWFDPEKGKTGNFFGPGFYFTSDYDIAKGYADNYVKLGPNIKKRGKLKGAKRVLEIVRELSGRAAKALRNDDINKEEYTDFLTSLERFAGKRKAESTEPASFSKMMRESYSGDTDGIYLETPEKVRNAIDMENYLTSQGREPYKGTIYTVFLNIRNPYNLDEVVGDKEIDEILAIGRKVGGDYNEFYLKHLWDEMTKKGQKEIADWLIKTGRGKRGKIREYKDWISLEGEGLTDAVAVRKIWDTLVANYTGDYDYKTKKIIKGSPLRHFKPGGKSGILTRQMLFRMLADWGHSDRGATLYTNYIKSKGYDGITHTGGWNIGTKDHKVWITFEPEQVKSTLNEGTFNPDDPDMFKGISMSEELKEAESGKVDFPAKLRDIPEGRALEAEYAKFMAMGKQLMPDLRREYEELEGEMEKSYDLAEAAVKRLAQGFQKFYPEDLDGLDIPFAASIIARARTKRKKEAGDERFPPELKTLEVKALKLCHDYLKVHDDAGRTFKEMTELADNLNPGEIERKRIERGQRRKKEREERKNG